MIKKKKIAIELNQKRVLTGFLFISLTVKGRLI
jgi:hypothetical protein